jgi:ketopantoate hydroxymethyltransferase
VAQATSQALLISDMPYQSYTSAKQTLENAKYLMQADQALFLPTALAQSHDSSSQDVALLIA